MADKYLSEQTLKKKLAYLSHRTGSRTNLNCAKYFCRLVCACTSGGFLSRELGFYIFRKVCIFLPIFYAILTLRNYIVLGVRK